ncbi:MAG: hypothetical protein HY231_15495 [Acidobacteria bacterium]|nr:hypothetical protein [Acidobacteriota bacterium]
MENERETKLRQQIEELVRSRVSVLEQDISHLQREVNESFTRLLERTDAASLLPEADPLAAQIVAQVTAEIDQATTSSVRLGADIALLRDSVAELDEQRNQAEVLNALVSRAANFAPRVVLFVVKGGNALAWAARGFDDGVGNNSIRGLSVSLQPDTALRAAISASQTCYGAADQQAENTLIFGRIGNAQPQRVLVVPLKVRGKAAAVFYADSADRGEDSISVEAIELLVHTAGLVVELVSLRARMGEVAQPAAKPAPPPSAPAVSAPLPTPTAPFNAPSPVSTPPPAPIAPPPAPAVQAPPPPNFFVQPTEAPAPTAFQHHEPAPPQPDSRYWSSPPASAENHVPPVEIQLTPPAPEAPSAFQTAPSFPVVVETPSAPEAHAAPSYEPQFVVTTPPPAPPLQTPQFFEPVVNTPPPAAVVTPMPPRPTVSEDEEKLHNDARRFARLLVSEIKLYNEQKVNEGRNHKDLYDRLKDDIDRSRQMYEKRVAPSVAAKFDYFYDEMVNTLAEGDASKLGSDYPGPSVAV